jgi:heterokaryon incompatibility protein (HET)
METFEYEPLPRGDDGQWIRLIELHRGQGSDGIECRIRHVNLADNPQYEAISYCWGDPTITSTIECSNNRQLTVTANLYAALSAIRFKDESRLLWADALCINQSDVDERNAQVAIMRSIYDKAQRVLVWLGEATDTSDRGLDFMERLVKACPQDIVLELQRTVLHHDPIKLLKRANASLSERDMRAFLSILQRPWFRRVWVVQEVVMLKDSSLLCGAPKHSIGLTSSPQFGLSSLPNTQQGVDISFLDFPNFIDKGSSRCRRRFRNTALGHPLQTSAISRD